MSRRWLALAFLLCPACGGTDAPPEGDKKMTGTTDPPADPAPSGGGDDGHGDTNPADPPADPGSSSHDDDATCKALWEIAEHFGCGIAKLICSAVEALPVGHVTVPCDVAVPIACGLASAAADAAEALCPGK